MSTSTTPSAETIAAFKAALKAGPVKFSFTKTDGTVRPALGTLNPKLIPTAEPGKKFKVTDIKPTNGILSVPKRLTLFITESKLAAAKVESEALTAALSEALGCSFTGSYSYCEAPSRKHKPLPSGSIFFYDLENKGFRSLVATSLLSFESAQSSRNIG